MIRSGIAPLDAHLGGVLPGRLHFLTGGVGTGKTSAGLHFLAAGFEAGETGVLLTLDRPAELRAHASYLGLDLDAPMRAGRLTALRFRPQFARRFAHAPSPEWVLQDLRRLLGRLILPGRIVIDPVTPFLADGSPAGAGLSALAELLDQLGTTALLTYPRPLSGDVDRRLDPIVERAATIATCTRDADVGFRMSIERARLAEAPAAPIPFAIVPGVGVVAAERAATSPEIEVTEPTVIQIARGS